MRQCAQAAPISRVTSLVCGAPNLPTELLATPIIIVSDLLRKHFFSHLSVSKLTRILAKLTNTNTKTNTKNILDNSYLCLSDQFGNAIMGCNGSQYWWGLIPQLYCLVSALTPNIVSTITISVVIIKASIISLQVFYMPLSYWLCLSIPNPPYPPLLITLLCSIPPSTFFSFSVCILILKYAI